MDAPPPLPAPVPDHFAASAGPRPGEVGVVGAAQARAYAPGPRWYRLPDESWAMIRAEYLAGATAKQLAVKWGVSPTSVYRHACADGFTKARRGEAINLEAVTRFAAQAAAAEARAAQAAREEVEAQGEAARHAREVEAEADPATAAATLLRRAAGAALKGRLDQAQALLRLAEGLARAAAAGKGTEAEAEAGAAGGGCTTWGAFRASHPYRPDPCEDEEAVVYTPEETAAMRDRIEARIAEILERDAPPGG